jgi:hypothetical protein
LDTGALDFDWLTEDIVQKAEGSSSQFVKTAAKRRIKVLKLVTERFTYASSSPQISRKAWNNVSNQKGKWLSASRP